MLVVPYWILIYCIIYDCSLIITLEGRHISAQSKGIDLLPSSKTHDSEAEVVEDIEDCDPAEAKQYGCRCLGEPGQEERVCPVKRGTEIETDCDDVGLCSGSLWDYCPDKLKKPENEGCACGGCCGEDLLCPGQERGKTTPRPTKTTTKARAKTTPGPPGPGCVDTRTGKTIMDGSFYEDCNQCSCRNGHGVICTQMACN